MWLMKTLLTSRCINQRGAGQANEASLQSIVAASFDESEEVFRQATQGVQYTLIEWDGKLLQPQYM